MRKKSEVAWVYQQRMDSTGKASCRDVGEAAGVSHKFARKVIAEVKSGRPVVPATVKRDHGRGRGLRSMTVEDKVVLLFLYNDCPGRSLKNYQDNLFQTTGTYVGLFTISRWFNYRHEYKGSVRKSNMVPIDKYTSPRTSPELFNTPWKSLSSHHSSSNSNSTRRQIGTLHRCEAP
jgi:hypothetical protein